MKKQIYIDFKVLIIYNFINLNSDYEVIMKKVNILLIIIILLIIVSITLEINRDYVIGKVVRVVSTDISSRPYSAVIISTNSSFGSNNEAFQINSKKELHIGDMVKVKLKYTPFKEDYITASSPGQFSQPYYITIIKKEQ